MKIQPSSAIENGLTAQFTKRVTPIPAPVPTDLLQRAEVDLQQHRDDHHPDQQADGKIDLRDLEPARSAWNGAGKD
jgi:hypothetical protein